MAEVGSNRTNSQSSISGGLDMLSYEEEFMCGITDLNRTRIWVGIWRLLR